MLNKKLLLQIKQAILTEPRGFQMGSFKKDSTSSMTRKCNDYDLSWDFPRCGTACCIAGYALELSGETFTNNSHNILPRARVLIGLYDHREGYKALSLFYLEDWPDDLRNRFMEAKTPEERAVIGAERIDRFLLGD